jgi:cytochrome c oxidase subunit 1
MHIHHEETLRPVKAKTYITVFFLLIALTALTLLQPMMINLALAPTLIIQIGLATLKAFLMFAGFHYWFPKFTGRMYSEKHAIRAFYTVFVGFNLLWFPMFLAGAFGMPRRYFDYLPEFEIYHKLSGVGSWIFAIGILYMLTTLYRGWRYGEPAGPNPWNATTLEWQIPSPPQLENFGEIPYVDFGPYEYKNGEPVHRMDLSVKEGHGHG